MAVCRILTQTASWWRSQTTPPAQTRATPPLRGTTGLEDLYTHDIADLDMQGDLYEYMLGKLATAGQNGQFRTPKHIRDMMVELVQPTPDDFICDPACGTAGFLNSGSILPGRCLQALTWTAPCCAFRP